jgi:hypothetical protein
MKALCLVLLASFLCVRAGAELDGLPPQRRAEIERLLADPFAVRADALATSQSLIYRFPSDAAELQNAWRRAEAIDDETLTIGEDLERQISLKRGQGVMTAAVAAELKQCVTNSVNARRVIVYGLVWPTAVSEGYAEAGIVLPPDLRARLRVKIDKSEIPALGFNSCGEVMRGYGIFPLKLPAP